MGARIVRAPSRRVHALHPHEWAEAGATDFWANFGNVAGVAGNAIGDLDLYGWLTNGFSYLAGSGADFLDSSALGTTGGANFDAVSDNLVSPFIFGDYAHGQIAAAILGYDPTTLNMECYARFAANNDEEETGFGFIEAGAARPFVKAGLMALITSDGTFFSIETGAAATAGSADNTDPHLFRITVSSASVAWSIDGTAQTAVQLQTGLWPVAWGASTKAATGANDPVISWVHIWYE